jgi:DtxR family manganese transport transcriptional regulator
MNDGARLGDALRQAASFDQTRRARQAAVAEDYGELIADLIDANGEARVVELAERFGVTHATVNKIVARLAREGLVSTKPYRSIFLTEAGHRLAEMSRRRHQIVLDFLKAIGVSEDTAELDAEGIEHHVSEETLAAFERLTRLHRRA